mmetsp:Transcript_2040/g.2897  ORF Transcript_2040/g.2897 Transcript_2040/m.2897 type:complete len:280 (+) Transcript_2040:24-863(+)
MSKFQGVRFDSERRKGVGQLREIRSEQSLLNRADGSAQFSFGKSCVLVGVYGPKEVPRVRDERIDRAIVRISVDPDKGSSKRPKLKQMQEDIKGCVESVLMLHLYPSCEISLIVQVIFDDGSALACAVNACCLALLDAGLALKSTFAASTCMRLTVTLEDDRETTMWWIDPTQQETALVSGKDSCCRGKTSADAKQDRYHKAQLSQLFSNKVKAYQASLFTFALTSEEHNKHKLLMMHCSGASFDLEAYQSGINICSAATKHLFSYYRLSFQQIFAIDK